MTQEALSWLNDNTLMGFVEHRDRWAGNGYVLLDKETNQYKAWWDNGDFNGAYPHAIPVEDVEQRLFNWQAEAWDLYVPNGETALDGYSKIEGFKAIGRGDTREVFKVFTDGYVQHQYREWLLDNVANLLDQSGNEMGIACAQTLKGGAVAYVSIELPDDIEVESRGATFSHRPTILAFTSLNGQHATGYALRERVPVCDNSFHAILYNTQGGEKTAFKIKHTSGSRLRLGEARDALGLLYKSADMMAQFIERLLVWEVKPRDFQQVRDLVLPVPDPQYKQNAGSGKMQITNQRAITMAETKRAQVSDLYERDPRAAPWNGTALGVLQAFNTFNTWEAGGNRGGEAKLMERAALRDLNGDQGDADREVFDALSTVTGKQLVPNRQGVGDRS